MLAIVTKYERFRQGKLCAYVNICSLGACSECIPDNPRHQKPTKPPPTAAVPACVALGKYAMMTPMPNHQ